MVLGNDINRAAYRNKRVAKLYHDSTKDLDMRWQWDIFLADLEDDAEILDMCCGAGRDAKEFTWRGYEVTGLDFSQELLDIATEEAPHASLLLEDARTFDLNKTFDGIWCNTGIFMFPHNEVPMVLERLARHLDSGSPMYINFKIGEGEHPYHDERYDVERYESYFSPEGFRKAIGDLFDVRREMVAYAQNPLYRTHPIMDVWCVKK